MILLHLFCTKKKQNLWADCIHHLCPRKCFLTTFYNSSAKSIITAALVTHILGNDYVELENF